MLIPVYLAVLILYWYSQEMPEQTDSYIATVDENFGAALKREREHRNLSQQALARRMRDLGFAWHPSTVGKIETRSRGVSIGEALALAAAVEVPVERLTIPDAASVDAVAARVRGYARWSIGALERAMQAVEAVSASVSALREELDILKGFDDTTDAFEPLLEAGGIARGFEHDVEEIFMRPAGEALLRAHGFAVDTFGPGWPEDDAEDAVQVEPVNLMDALQQSISAKRGEKHGEHPTTRQR